MNWNLPNLLTIFRIILVPFFILIFYLPFDNNHIIAAIVFALASITDWLDGYLARLYEQTSKLGAFLDPVADKLMVAVALVVIVSEYPYWWVAIPCAAVISREIVVSALREWMAELGKRATVKVSNFGKIKTACQMIAIFIIIFVTPSHKSQPHFDVWSIIGFILLYAAVILTVYSMWNYLVAAYYTVQQDKKEQL